VVTITIRAESPYQGKLRRDYVSRAALTRFHYELRQAISIKVELMIDRSELNSSKSIRPRIRPQRSRGTTKGRTGRVQNRAYDD